MVIDEFFGQHLYKETILGNRELDKYSGKELNEKVSEEESLIKEAMQKAIDNLMERVNLLIECFFTEHQKQIYKLMLKGLTYEEIAKELNHYSSKRSGYTSVAYAIKGIKVKGFDSEYHGGLERKIRKICLRDKICLKIIQDIKYLKEHNVNIALLYLQKNDKWYIDYRRNFNE